MTRQYEHLPYPQVQEKTLLEEEDYYKRVKDVPRYMHLTHILEKLNHFLYRGEQDFR